MQDDTNEKMMSDGPTSGENGWYEAPPDMASRAEKYAGERRRQRYSAKDLFGDLDSEETRPMPYDAEDLSAEERDTIVRELSALLGGLYDYQQEVKHNVAENLVTMSNAYTQQHKGMLLAVDAIANGIIDRIRDLEE